MGFRVERYTPMARVEGVHSPGLLQRSEAVDLRPRATAGNASHTKSDPCSPAAVCICTAYVAHD